MDPEVSEQGLVMVLAGVALLVLALAFRAAPRYRRYRPETDVGVSSAPPAARPMPAEPRKVLPIAYFHAESAEEVADSSSSVKNPASRNRLRPTR